MPNTVIAGNWKMNLNPSEAIQLARGVKDGLEASTNVEVVLCPPAISLIGVREAVKGSAVRVGAQNMHFEDSGAFTGEISPLMLQGICDYVILGHSERRQLFGETDDLVNLKVKAAFRHGLRPILCVGETLEQREGGQANTVVEAQVRAGLSDIVDISVALTSGIPIWPDSVGLRVTRTLSRDAGDPVNVSRLDCDVHVGTHIDAPSHFLDDGKTIEELSLDVLIGPAVVAHVPEAKEITADVLEGLVLPADTRRLLLKTSNSRLWDAPGSRDRR